MTNPEGTGSRYTRHSRDDVVAAALRILDVHGLPDLTMRRLAATLDVQPSALYWHFPSKQALLASIADQIVSRATPSSEADGPWKSATRAEAESLRDALLAFRDGAEVVSSTLALGLGAGNAQDRLVRPIRGAGIDGRTSEIAAAALLHFILGHVSHEQQRIQADSLGVVVPEHSADPTNLASDSRESFDFGITLLLSGLELQTQADRDPAAAR